MTGLFRYMDALDRIEEARRGPQGGLLDDKWAFGRLQLDSSGEFTATRRGNSITIEGTVEHGFNDRYDFNPGEPYLSDPHLLEQHGRAKPFDRTASWKRRVSGTIRVDSRNLKDARFKWEDVDQ